MDVFDKHNEAKKKRGIKALVFSDTHGNIDDCIFIIKENNDAELVIHAGDCVDDAENLSYIFPNVKFEYVRGNNDLFSKESDEKVVSVFNRKIFLTHGHIYGVKNGLSKLLDKAKKLECDIAIFGHTHIVHYENRGGVALLNPGASRGSRASYAVIEVFEDDFEIEVVEL